jgi:hypothetical protein
LKCLTAKKLRKQQKILNKGRNTMATISITPETMQEVGTNIRAVQQGNFIIMVVDTTAPSFSSTRGKMILKATTGGFAMLPGGLKANINIGKNK